MSADSRISDDRLTELLVDLSPNNVMRRKDLEGILSALTELRERRAQAATVPEGVRDALLKARDYLDRNGNGWDEIPALDGVRAALAKIEEHSNGQ